MSERIRKVILGFISGIVVAVCLDLIGSYFATAPSVVRMVIAGVMGYLVFVGLDSLSMRGKHGS